MVRCAGAFVEAPLTMTAMLWGGTRLLSSETFQVFETWKVFSGKSRTAKFRWMPKRVRHDGSVWYVSGMTGRLRLGAAMTALIGLQAFIQRKGKAQSRQRCLMAPVILKQVQDRFAGLTRNLFHQGQRRIYLAYGKSPTAKS